MKLLQLDLSGLAHALLGQAGAKPGAEITVIKVVVQVIRKP